MKTIIKNEIFDSKVTASVVDELQPTLYDLIALGLLVKQAHWNVVGPHFRSLHLHLDELWSDVQTSVDTVAERIATLGVSPSGQTQDVTANTELSPLPTGFLRDAEVIDLITERLAAASRLIRDRLSRIEEPDPVTADLIHAVLEGIEKHLWMFRSTGL